MPDRPMSMVEKVAQVKAIMWGAVADVLADLAVTAAHHRDENAAVIEERTDA